MEELQNLIVIQDELLTFTIGSDHSLLRKTAPAGQEQLQEEENVEAEPQPQVDNSSQ